MFSSIYAQTHTHFNMKEPRSLAVIGPRRSVMFNLFTAVSECKALTKRWVVKEIE